MRNDLVEATQFLTNPWVLGVIAILIIVYGVFWLAKWEGPDMDEEMDGSSGKEISDLEAQILADVITESYSL